MTMNQPPVANAELRAGMKLRQLSDGKQFLILEPPSHGSPGLLMSGSGAAHVEKDLRFKIFSAKSWEILRVCDLPYPHASHDDCPGIGGRQPDQLETRFTALEARFSQLEGRYELLMSRFVSALTMLEALTDGEGSTKIIESPPQR